MNKAKKLGNINERHLAGGLNITRGRSTPMEMHFLEDPAPKPTLTATKNQRMAVKQLGGMELPLLLSPQMGETVPP
jgi:hypothetical protein